MIDVVEADEQFAAALAAVVAELANVGGPAIPGFDLRGAKGVQVNQAGGNTQTNTFS